MKISTLKHSVVDSIKGLLRHKTLSIASIATVAATLFLFGIFILSAVNIKQLINKVESKVEVTVVLKDNVTSEEKKSLEDKINLVDGVKSITFKSKKDALSNFKEQLGKENEALLEGLDKENPLPSSLIVKVKEPSVVHKVVKKINGTDGVAEIKDGKKIVDKISSFTSTLKWVGAALLVILIGVSLFLIGNTIKITVYSRKREIGIMKYIGATDWFIRWPFIFEGIIIGILGALVSVVVLYYLYQIAYVRASSGLMVFVKLVAPNFVFSTVLWMFILGGVIIGIIGSVLSIRKFLAV